MLISQPGGLLSCRGVLSGITFGTAPFSTSSSSLAINSEVTSTFDNANAELGVSPLTSDTIPQDGKWYEIIIT